MHRAIPIMVWAALAALTLPAGAAPLRSRPLELVYRVEIPAVPTDQGPVHVFLPLASSGPDQEIVRRRVTSEVPGVVGVETRYGNAFWHGTLARGLRRPVTVEVRYHLVRRPDTPLRRALGQGESADPSEQELYLQPNQRVPVDSPLVRGILDELPLAGLSSRRRARVLFDYVLTNMEYKKVGRGWGNGDTDWACSRRYGNCTDFHALLTSLARGSGIPARFGIGFSVPEARAEGEIAGYHCWVDLYLPEEGGWFPVDASEAWKHLERREFLFGSQSADRVLFSVGRDLELGPGHAAGPLNYFLYPHVEVEGRRLEGVGLEVRFRELGTPPN